MDYLLSLSHLEGRAKSLPNMKESLTSSLSTLLQNDNTLTKQSAVVSLSKDFYRKALDVIYEKSLGEITNVLNEALKYIYFDCTYQVNLVLDDKRATKQLEIEIVDYSYNPPLALDIKEGVGSGIRAVVSFTLHMYFLLNNGAYPILFLDETYSSISQAYKERFFSFVSDLSKAKGFSTVFITHTTEAVEFADKVYVINDGVAKELER